MLPPNLFPLLNQPPSRPWTPVVAARPPKPEPRPVELSVALGWRAALLVRVAGPLRLARWHHA